jgi:hypothetical protein
LLFAPFSVSSSIFQLSLVPLSVASWTSPSYFLNLFRLLYPPLSVVFHLLIYFSYLLHSLFESVLVASHIYFCCF